MSPENSFTVQNKARNTHVTAVVVDIKTTELFGSIWWLLSTVFRMKSSMRQTSLLANQYYWDVLFFCFWSSTELICLFETCIVSMTFGSDFSDVGILVDWMFVWFNTFFPRKKDGPVKKMLRQKGGTNLVSWLVQGKSGRVVSILSRFSFYQATKSLDPVFFLSSKMSSQI